MAFRSVLLPTVVCVILALKGAEGRFPQWVRLGVLSQGNFDTVHHLVPNAEPVIAGDQAELYAKVEAGEVDAALISGVPDASRFNVIPSGSISPRAMLTRPGDSRTRRIVDAGIVRLQNNGKLFDYADANQPFSFLEVHTCRSANPDLHFPLDELEAGLDSNETVTGGGEIRVGALGPYNWSQDGDYTATPPTGFWPDFLRGMEEVLPNYTFTRVWYPGSSGVMNALAAGEVDVTEPYWTVDSFHNERPRTWFFDAGCTTLGYESNFFTAKAQLASTNGSSSDSSWVIPIAAVLGALVLIAAVVVAVMIHRERQGTPLFRKPLLGSQPYSVFDLQADGSQVASHSKSISV